MLLTPRELSGLGQAVQAPVPDAISKAVKPPEPASFPWKTVAVGGALLGVGLLAWKLTEREAPRRSAPREPVVSDLERSIREDVAERARYRERDLRAIRRQTDLVAELESRIDRWKAPELQQDRWDALKAAERRLLEMEASYMGEAV